MILMKLIYLIVLLMSISATLCDRAQAQRQRRARPSEANINAAVDRTLTGVYRLDPESSDRLYSAVAGASSKVPFEGQQRFLIDLTIRLTPPDLIAIEQNGATISIASSRAPRITFRADGTVHAEQIGDGQTIRNRAVLTDGGLTVTSSGNRNIDKFTVTFRALDRGRRLRITRRIYAEQLIQAIDVQSIYNKVSDVAQWSIYGEEQPQPPVGERVVSSSVESPSIKVEQSQAQVLRDALDRWIAATNAKDVEEQMRFYQPQVEAFYLARNVSRASVRAEKMRVFAKAVGVDVRAAEPEIIFRDAGRAAIMRFRKQYKIDQGRQSRRGEVVQELRWQLINGSWKITSERDVKVIR
ncbi:MAG: hypothetical protein WKF30_15050 [Pyrinomonadaceae bacterium]